MITTRWFSSSLSDPTSRWAPCAPKRSRWWLQVRLSVSRLSPSCLSSLSIPSHPLWPVRRYPHLRISARGLGLSGTSTHLNALAVRHTLRIGPPQCSASVLSPHGFRRLCFSLAIRALVPAVPRKGLHPVHAPSTPVAVCPVIRHPTDLSQWDHTPLVLTTSGFLTTRLRWVYFRSSPGHTSAQGLSLNFGSNAHHYGSLPQRLGVI